MGVITYRQALHDTLIEEMRRDPAVVLLGEEIGRLEQDQGISCEVIDVRSLRPLDRPTLIESVKKTSRAVVVEEDWYSYGVGAELVATIQEGAFDYLDAPIRRVAQAEVPLPYAKVMEQTALPKAQNLVDAIKSTLDASGYRNRRTPA